MLIEAVVHAVNEDYRGMAGDFIKLGFLQPGRQSCPDCSIMPLAAFFVAHTHTYLFGCFFDSDDQSDFSYQILLIR